MKKTYQLREKMWLYPGKAGWYFITIPTDVSKEIDFYFSQQKKGWGSIRVKVILGTTSWMTSIFPDKKSASYLLPVKSLIRKQESLRENDLVAFAIEISD